MKSITIESLMELRFVSSPAISPDGLWTAYVTSKQNQKENTYESWIHLLNNQTANTQRILDQLCADKIDAKNEKIADLERQLTMANLAASQTAQTSRILADNASQTVALEQYLNPVPVPAYIVQNPNCCQQACGGY